LGWNPGILNESGCKPKSMQWRTFNKLKETHDDFVQVAIAGMIEQAGLINRQLNSAKNSLKFDWRICFAKSAFFP